MHKIKEQGFALLLSMLVLGILSTLVIGSVRSTVSMERGSGAQLDRAVAYQAAEQALLQGKTLLMANSDLCLSGCSVAAGVVAAGAAAVALPAAWNAANATVATLAANQPGSAQYVIQQLNTATFVSPASGVSRSDCVGYSIMGRGVGRRVGEVVLQTVVWLCPV